MASRISNQAWSKGLDAGTVHTINSNNRTSNCQYRLFSKKNPIIRIFYISGCLTVPIIPDKQSSIVLHILSACSQFQISSMLCAILSSVACVALQYFSTLSHKRHDFRGGGKLLNKKCVLRVSIQLFSETFFILRRNERDTKNAHWSSCKEPLICVRFY